MVAQGGTGGATTKAAGSGLNHSGMARAPALLLEKGKEAAVDSEGNNSGESLAEMMKRLNLTPKEATPFILDRPLILDDVGENPLCPDWLVVGKVLAPNTLHIDTITAVVWPAWGNPEGLIVRSVGPNLFLVEFKMEADRVRVMKGGPWRLGKHAILLKCFDPRTNPLAVVFDELHIWVRIMKPGSELMNAERGTPLATMVGNVEKLEVDDKGRAWGDYLRARVTIDPTQPLMRIVSVFSMRKNETVQYDLMYEHLPMYCFSCGLLGHSSLVCPTPGTRDKDGKLPYSRDRLCVPEKRKNDIGSSTENSQSSRISWSGNEYGSGSRPVPAKPKGPTDAHGEVTSAKKKGHGCKQVARFDWATEPAGAEVSLSQPDKLRVTGQKRKQAKQVYRVKGGSSAAPDLPPPPKSSTAIVPVGTYLDVAPVDVANPDGVENSEVDHSKKQKTGTTRSAYPAEAASRPRQTQ